MAKIALIFAVLLTLGAAILGFMNKGTLDQVRGERDSAQAQVESTTAQLAQVRQEKEEVESERDAQAAAAQQATEQLETAQGQVEELRTAQAEIQERLTARENELNEVREQLAAAQETDAPVEEVVEQPGEVDELRNQLAAAEGEKELLTNKLAEVEAQLTTMREREEARQGRMMARSLEGTVQAVNPAWNFVVLDLGDRQGVAQGAEMIVRRGPQMVGRVRISSVEPSTSVADIISEVGVEGLRIQPGDRVIYEGS